MDARMEDCMLILLPHHPHPSFCPPPTPPPSTLPNPAPVARRPTAPFSFDGSSFRCVCVCVSGQMGSVCGGIRPRRMTHTHRCATFLTVCAPRPADGDVRCQRRQLSSRTGGVFLSSLFFGVVSQGGVCSARALADCGVSFQPPHEIGW